MRAYQIAPGSTSVESLEKVDLSDVEPGPGEVKIRVRATSLNFRDQAIIKGTASPHEARSLYAKYIGA